MRNSRRDPVALEVEAAVRTQLEEAADAADAALSEYMAAPRWCGRPGDDAFPGSKHYPHHYLLLQQRGELGSIKHPDRVVVDMPSAIEYHREVIERLAVLLRDHLPRSNYDLAHAPGRETPRAFLDRIRGTLRWEYRTDSMSLVTQSLALLRCVKVGRPMPCEGISPPRTLQRYGYDVLPEAEIDLFPAARALSACMERAFRTAERALMPLHPNARERLFLDWMKGRGGECRVSELTNWLDEDPPNRGKSSRGQGTERVLLRKFCEKNGPAGSRRIWRLRNETISLLLGSASHTASLQGEP